MFMFLDTRKEMQITSLDKMETIVKSRSNLEWDGWDVIVYKRDNAGFLKQDGAFRYGRWHTMQRIPVTREGWSVPKRWAS